MIGVLTVLVLLGIAYIEAYCFVTVTRIVREWSRCKKEKE